MSDLTVFRDHARKMAAGGHDPICAVTLIQFREVRRPAPRCPGCLSDADRALWAQLAGEVDDYLTRPLEDDTVADRTQEEALLS